VESSHSVGTDAGSAGILPALGTRSVPSLRDEEQARRLRSQQGVTHVAPATPAFGLAPPFMTRTSERNDLGELDHLSASTGSSQLYDLSPERDKLGRITHKTETVGGVVETYGYDLAGRLETVEKNGSPNQTYSYDANGNRLTFTDAWGTEVTTISSAINRKATIRVEPEG